MVVAPLRASDAPPTLLFAPEQGIAAPTPGLPSVRRVGQSPLSMATITLDAQTFSIDGRRRFLVSGLLDPARIPAALWDDRLRAARQAGLNCIGVPVVWSRHEPAPGRFDFEGDRDIASFIRRIGAMGMHCILRPGPFVGAGHDRGGLPAWLTEGENLTLRSNTPGFLEACARYISALADQVRDLQATASKPGPILLVQCEHRWFCGDEVVGQAYLGELTRYLRESGVRTPLVATNNLFQTVEGQVDAWNGFEGLFSVLRQLRAVRPEQPSLVIDFELDRPAVWGQAPIDPPSPDDTLHALAQTLAAGGQFQLGSFCAGTRFGFSAGRLPFEREGFLTTGAGDNAPLGEAGERGPMYDAARRVCTFASSFDRVFAGLDADHRPIAADPAAGASVVHCKGGQGSVVFVFRDPKARGRDLQRPAQLSLDDGAPMEVRLDDQPVAWCLLSALINERATLDWCNASAFARIGKVFCCFAPAGSPVNLSINGSAITVDAPGGKTPNAFEHEGVRVVVCNRQQIDAAYLADDALYVGVSGIDSEGAPIAHSSFKQAHRFPKDGSHERIKPATPVRKPVRPTFEAWQAAPATTHVDGASDRFATIGGPATLESLGATYGYGWLRLTTTSGAARKVTAGLFEAADRVHLYVNGKAMPVFGLGPGATTDFPTIPLKRGRNVVTMLVDNMGRAAGGAYNAEPKGVWGHIWDSSPMKLGKPKVQSGDPISPLTLRSPISRLHPDDKTAADRATWEIIHRKKSPIAVTIDAAAMAPPGAPAASGLLLVNDQPVHYFTEGGWDRIVLDEPVLSRGKNIIQIALLDDAADIAARATKGVAFHDCGACVTEGVEWAFAVWERPGDAAFQKAAKAGAAKHAGAPCWWRTTFGVKRTDSPLFFEAAGLSKGQIFLNGHNVGRYFVNAGKAKVPGQDRYYLPEPWLKTDGENELVIFDEHGADPSKTSVTY